ncbi:MAG TPA: thioredoxin domain-containing protein [Anaerolineae bacterium]|nr:thioredoxin domain-containing protein [Anaerolineae bacterium]
MAKRNRKRKQQEKRQTNWVLVGGVVGAGVVLLLVLLALSWQGSTGATANNNSLMSYCEANPEACISRGNPEAEVTIYEVSDYACGHCQDFNVGTAPQLDAQYVDTGLVRWVSVPYALRNETVPVTNAALCANEQGAYFEFGHYLYTHFDEPDIRQESGVLRAAGDIGLDVDSFQQCVDNNRYVNTVINNIEAARDAGVQGTPTFFINEDLLRTGRSLTSFQQALQPLVGQ